MRARHAVAAGGGCRKTRQGGAERGAALVEFAIIAPLVFALLIGMFSGGMALSRKNSMTNAVREGARLGATLPDNTSWVDSTRGRVVQLASGDLTASQVCVKLAKKVAPQTTNTSGSDTVLRSSTCTLPSALEPSTAGVEVGTCVVKVWSSRQSPLQVVFFSRSLTLDAASITRYERDC